MGRTPRALDDQLSNLEKAALLSGRDVWHTRAIARLGIESISMADGPHGVRKQLGSADHVGLHPSLPATCFPTAATLANSWDAALIERVGRALGAEAAAQEVDVLLGPGLNIKRSPLAGRNFEYFSEDPYLSGKLAAALVRGIQTTGVAATPKHFAVNSQELRRMASDSIVDERTLREIYLTGFEIAVREGKPHALMTSYNLINGCYANQHHQLLVQILRNEWGFDGMVMTDWGGSNDVVAGVAAGGGVEMPASGHESTRLLVDAVAAGRLRQSDLDARAREVIRLAQGAASIQHRPADMAAHHELARAAAAGSLVLLRNQHPTIGDAGQAILPLAAGTRVAIIGDMAETPRYQGAGSSLVNAAQLVTPIEALAASPLQVVGFARGYQRVSVPDAKLIGEAAELAADADVALVFLGLDEVSETEGVDRSHLELPDAQLQLLTAVHAANPATVVLLSAGCVVATNWAEQAAAIIHGYLAGQAGALAIADVLIGRTNPSGKLAESYPRALSDTPTPHFPASGRYALYREGPFIGYRHYDSAAIEVAYPFGYGLSYSTFDYADLVVDQAGVEFTITNSSPRAGAEIAQLYVGLPGSRLVRPVKELKGFTKIHLDANQSARVRIDFDEYTWRHFDVETGQWRTEAGRWRLQIGASSADIRLTAELDRDGVMPAERPELAAYLAGDVRRVTLADFEALLGRPVPRETPSTELSLNSPLFELAQAASPLGRLAFGVLDLKRRRSEARGAPDLDTQFVYNMPIRALAKVTGGRISMEMAEGFVDLFNGHHRRGLSTIIGGFRRNRRDNARVAEMLQRRNP